MKTTKIYLWIMIIGMVSLMGFTSCLGDSDSDNDNSYVYRELSTLEKEIAVSSAAGSYSGKFYFINLESKLDSVDTQLSISAPDSLVTAKIPVAGLKASLQRRGTPEDKLAVFLQTPDPELKMVLHPYYNQYWGANDYTFYYTYANNSVAVPFTIDEAHHVAVFNFADRIILSTYDIYDRMAEYYNNRFFCNVLLESITLDDQLYSINTCMTIEVKKQ